MTLTETYTCNKCGGGIPTMGIGYITDGSLVIARVSIPDSESGVTNTFHFHLACYSEWVESLDAEADNAS